MKFKKSDIKILLENCYVQPSQSYTYNGFEVESDEEIESDLSQIEFSHSQVNAIRKYFVQLSPADKILCKKYLLSGLNESISQVIATASFLSLIHLGFYIEAFKKITTSIVGGDRKSISIQLFSDLSEAFKKEWNIFTKADIDTTYKWADETVDGKNELGGEMKQYPALYAEVTKVIYSLWRKLNVIKFKDLKEEIFSETSQEITTDEKALKVEFKRNNFPDYLTDTLDEISLKISTANTNFDYKACMGLIRAFLESVFKHIAESLDPLQGKNVDEKDSEKVTKFFMDKQLISFNQAELLRKYVHFLSNEGVHRLKSRSDDARLSRNMMIELGLYLLLRLKDSKEN